MVAIRFPVRYAIYWWRFFRLTTPKGAAEKLLMPSMCQRAPDGMFLTDESGMLNEKNDIVFSEGETVKIKLEGDVYVRVRLCLTTAT